MKNLLLLFICLTSFAYAEIFQGSIVYDGNETIVSCTVQNENNVIHNADIKVNGFSIPFTSNTGYFAVIDILPGDIVNVVARDSLGNIFFEQTGLILPKSNSIFPKVYFQSGQDVYALSGDINALQNATSYFVAISISEQKATILEENSAPNVKKPLHGVVLEAETFDEQKIKIPNLGKHFYRHVYMIKQDGEIQIEGISSRMKNSIAIFINNEKPIDNWSRVYKWKKKNFKKSFNVVAGDVFVILHQKVELKDVRFFSKSNVSINALKKWPYYGGNITKNSDVPGRGFTLVLNANFGDSVVTAYSDKGLTKVIRKFRFHGRYNGNRPTHYAYMHGLKLPRPTYLKVVDGANVYSVKIDNPSKRRDW